MTSPWDLPQLFVSRIQFWICDMPEGFQPEYNNDSDSYLVFKASILIPLMLGKISVRNHVQIQMHAAFAIAKSRRYCKPLYHVRVRQMVDKYPCHGASQFCRSCFKQPQFLDLIDSDLLTIVGETEAARDIKLRNALIRHYLHSPYDLWLFQLQALNIFPRHF
ncbi:hypothetical protein KCU97_g22, partial [Aureobasidium melanogenum]